jgi:hypothetical protein
MVRSLVHEVFQANGASQLRFPVIIARSRDYGGTAGGKAISELDQKFTGAQAV